LQSLSSKPDRSTRQEKSSMLSFCFEGQQQKSQTHEGRTWQESRLSRRRNLLISSRKHLHEGTGMSTFIYSWLKFYVGGLWPCVIYEVINKGLSAFPLRPTCSPTFLFQEAHLRTRLCKRTRFQAFIKIRRRSFLTSIFHSGRKCFRRHFRTFSRMRNNVFLILFSFYFWRATGNVSEIDRSIVIAGLATTGLGGPNCFVANLSSLLRRPKGSLSKKELNRCCCPEHRPSRLNMALSKLYDELIRFYVDFLWHDMEGRALPEAIENVLSSVLWKKCI